MEQRTKSLILLILIIVFVAIAGMNGYKRGYDARAEDETCMDYSTFHDRQMTLIFCDHYLGNCKNKADVWFEENPNWTQYNFSMENASWFGEGF